MPCQYILPRGPRKGQTCNKGQKKDWCSRHKKFSNQNTIEMYTESTIDDTHKPEDGYGSNEPDPFLTHQEPIEVDEESVPEIPDREDLDDDNKNDGEEVEVIYSKLIDKGKEPEVDKSSNSDSESSSSEEDGLEVIRTTNKGLKEESNNQSELEIKLSILCNEYPEIRQRLGDQIQNKSISIERRLQIFESQLNNSMTLDIMKSGLNIITTSIEGIGGLYDINLDGYSRLVMMDQEIDKIMYTLSRKHSSVIDKIEPEYLLIGALASIGFKTYASNKSSNKVVDRVTESTNNEESKTDIQSDTVQPVYSSRRNRENRGPTHRS